MSSSVFQPVDAKSSGVSFLALLLNACGGPVRDGNSSGSNAQAGSDASENDRMQSNGDHPATPVHATNGTVSLSPSASAVEHISRQSKPTGRQNGESQQGGTPSASALKLDSRVPSAKLSLVAQSTSLSGLAESGRVNPLQIPSQQILPPQAMKPVQIAKSQSPVVAAQQPASVSGKPATVPVQTPQWSYAPEQTQSPQQFATTQNALGQPLSAGSQQQLFSASEKAMPQQANVQQIEVLPQVTVAQPAARTQPLATPVQQPASVPAQLPQQQINPPQQLSAAQQFIASREASSSLRVDMAKQQQAAPSGAVSIQRGSASQSGTVQPETQSQDANSPSQPSTQQVSALAQLSSAFELAEVQLAHSSATPSIDAPNSETASVKTQMISATNSKSQADIAEVMLSSTAGLSGILNLPQDASTTVTTPLPANGDKHESAINSTQTKLPGLSTLAIANSANVTGKGKIGTAQGAETTSAPTTTGAQATTTQSASNQTDSQAVQHSVEAAPAVAASDKSLETTLAQAAITPAGLSAHQSPTSHSNSAGVGDASPLDGGSEAVQTDPSQSGAVQGSSGINSARLIQSLGETEMRVGMHSSEFGDISVRTSVSQQQMSAQISVDHSALSAAISARIPSMQERFGNEHGVQASIQIHQGGASFGDGREQSSQREQKSAFRHAPIDNAPAGIEAELSALRAPPGAGDEYRLDIRA